MTDFPKLQLKLMKVGFRPYSKPINGFRPHFSKGNDILFLIGANFGISRIVKINQAFDGYEGKVYGVLITPNSPRCADKDWVTSPNLILLNDDLEKGQWSKDGNSIEYVPYAFS